MEVFDRVKEQDDSPQETFYSCSLVNRTWCAAATPFLYEAPQDIERNINAFVNAIRGKTDDQDHSAPVASSSSSTLTLTRRGNGGVHVKKTEKKATRPSRSNSTPLGQYVRVLDMSGFTYHSSNSLTAKMIFSTKNRLQELVAPAYSFSYAPPFFFF